MCDQVPRRAGCAVAQSLSSPYVHLVRIHVNPHPRPPHDPQSTHYSSSGPASPRSLRLTQETRLAGQPTHRPTLPISSLATPPGAFPAHPSQCPAATRRGRIDSPPARFDARGCLFRHPLNARLGPSHELGVAVEHLRDHGCECKQDAGGIHSPRDGDEQHVHLRTARVCEQSAPVPILISHTCEQCAPMLAPRGMRAVSCSPACVCTGARVCVSVCGGGDWEGGGGVSADAADENQR
eukprot:scaffold3414_cov113-Isochrysis_galbana.AAC.4